MISSNAEVRSIAIDGKIDVAEDVVALNDFFTPSTADVAITTTGGPEALLLVVEDAPGSCSSELTINVVSSASSSTNVMLFDSLPFSFNGCKTGIDISTSISTSLLSILSEFLIVVATSSTVFMVLSSVGCAK